MKYGVGDSVRILSSADDHIDEIMDMLGKVYKVDQLGAILYYINNYCFVEDELELVHKAANCPVINEKGTVFKDAEVQHKVGILKEFIKCGPDIYPIAICECGASSLGYNTHADYCPKKEK